jgi:hypothetical protein
MNNEAHVVCYVLLVTANWSSRHYLFFLFRILKIFADASKCLSLVISRFHLLRSHVLTYCMVGLARRNIL